MKSSVKYAYVTLVMRDIQYLKGVLALASSYRRVAAPGCERVPFVVMVTEEIKVVAESQLQNWADSIVVVPPIVCKGNLKTAGQRAMYENWINFSFTKFNCLALTQYDKVLFLDADMVFLRNIDHIFESISAPAGCFEAHILRPYVNSSSGAFNPYFGLKHGDVVPEAAITKALSNNGTVCCAAFLLLEPNQNVFEEFKQFLTRYASCGIGRATCYSGSDEQAIAEFYVQKQVSWCLIHQSYLYVPWKPKWIRNCKYLSTGEINEIRSFDARDNFDLPEQPFMLHYFDIKPWKMERSLWPDLAIWYSCFDDTQDPQHNRVYSAGKDSSQAPLIK